MVDPARRARWPLGPRKSPGKASDVASSQETRFPRPRRTILRGRGPVYIAKRSPLPLVLPASGVLAAVEAARRMARFLHGAG